ncbi:MAG: RNA-binding S4 domain-containing protein, partial [Bacteroidales bacterium]
IMKTQFPLRKDQEYIHLIQLLKATNMVDNGALAQELVVEGEVKVNGEVEYQKRKKIRKGDKVEIWEEVIEVI